MKRELLNSSAIIIFVALTVWLMKVLKMFSSDLTVPFVTIILSLVGGIAVSWVSFDSVRSEGANKYTVVFGVCALLLFSFGAYMSYSIFIL